MLACHTQNLYIEVHISSLKTKVADISLLIKTFTSTCQGHSN